MCRQGIALRAAAGVSCRQALPLRRQLEMPGECDDVRQRRREARAMPQWPAAMPWYHDFCSLALICK